MRSIYVSSLFSTFAAIGGDAYESLFALDDNETFIVQYHTDVISQFQVTNGQYSTNNSVNISTILGTSNMSA